MKRTLTITGLGLLFAVGLHLGAWDDATLRSPRFALAEDVELPAPLPYYNGITSPAAAHEAAVRGTVVQETPPPTAPPTTVGLLGLPTDGDCASWFPLLLKYGITDLVGAERIMRRESGCTNAHNYNSSTRDHSHGPLQVNIYGRLESAWADLGFSHDYLHTPEGAIAAAGVLYRSCGWGPWTKPYSCPGGWPL